MNNQYRVTNTRFGKLNVLLIVLFGAVFHGCASQENTRPPLTGAGLVEKLRSGWNPVILDVRSRLEYNAGHVPGAQQVSFWTPVFSHDEVPADPKQPVVVYCEHGPRAYIAAWGLKKAGFKDIMFLDGHMSQWRKDGLLIEKPEVD